MDLDFTMDTGTYIMLMSMAGNEDEHLLAPGADFEVGSIHFKNSTLSRLLILVLLLQTDLKS